MATTDYYCDPSSVADPGEGDGLTVGTAFGSVDGCLQYALDHIVAQDVVDGDRLLLLDKGTETLTATLNFTLSYGTPNAAYPLYIEGRQADGSVANYETGVGMATISMGGGAFTIDDNSRHVGYYHLDIKDSTAAAAVKVSVYNQIVECYVSDASAIGILLKSQSSAVNCSISNCGTVGVQFDHYGTVTGCYVRSRTADSNGAMTTGILLNGFLNNTTNNIVSVDGATIGIDGANSSRYICRNSVLAAVGSTGKGIQANGLGLNAIVTDNLVEGFNTGGTGIDYDSSANPAFIKGNNAVYNCGTFFADSSASVMVRLDDIILAETPFAKSGSDTFTNRKAYFAPRDISGILGGAFI